MGWGLILLTVGSLGCDSSGGTPTDSPPEDLLWLHHHESFKGVLQTLEA